MINTYDILETIRMIQDECLDIRTTTMGISLLDCADTDIDKACAKVYDKICTKAEKLVQTGEDIEREYGIPIINKRVSVTPIAIMAGISGGDPVKYALALETVNNQYLGGDTSLACSAQTQREIDQRVVELVKAQHEKAIKILTDNRAKLDELAKYLYEKETITGDEFMAILEEKDSSEN